MGAKTTDEQRLKALQAKIAKRTEVTTARKEYEAAKDKLKKLRKK